MTGLTRKQGTNPAANIVTGMTYGPAGQLLTMQHWQNAGTAGQLETRQYNVMGQLTRIQAPAAGPMPQVDLEYIYSGTQNNGRITQRKNWVSGETVSYTYDSLQRLTQASATGPSPWSESYTFDGFGNLTGKAGSSWTVNGFTNQIVAPPGIPLSYDANGNQLNGSTSAYDIENRLLTWDGPEQYRYGVDNRRVFRRYTDAQGGAGHEVYSLYGPNGKVSVELIAAYDPAFSALPTPGMVLTPVKTYQYVGLRRVGWSLPMEDRLGSRAGSSKPYGEDAPRFGTHDRDAATGLHYADQRYYSSGWGRFLTADMYMHNPRQNSPQSWNLYSYGDGDPIGNADPTGLFSDPCASAGCLMAPPEQDNSSPPGGSIAWTSGPLCVYNSWLPVPACLSPVMPAPEPAQAPKQRPALICSYVGSQTTAPGFSTNPVTGAFAFNIPIFFEFSASGGTGEYSWSNHQTGSQSGSISYSTEETLSAAKSIDESIEFVMSARQILKARPTGPRATLYDAPGIPLFQQAGRVVAASVAWNFNLTVTVQSGEQRVICPVVNWQASLVWQTTNGNRSVFGAASVISVR